MSLPNSGGTRAVKGQFKCFQCRQPFSSKDGNWHVQQNQQVFLCKHCERAQREAAQKEASARTR